MIIVLFLCTLLLSVNGQTCISALNQSMALVVHGYSENDPGACLVDGDLYPLLLPILNNNYVVSGGFRYFSSFSGEFMDESINLANIDGIISFITDNPADTTSPEITMKTYNVGGPCTPLLTSTILKPAGVAVPVKNVTCGSCVFSLASGYCAIWNVTFNIPLAALASNLGGSVGYVTLEVKFAVSTHAIYDISVDTGIDYTSVILMTPADYFVPSCNAALSVYNPSIVPCPQTSSQSASDSMSLSQSMSPSLSESASTTETTSPIPIVCCNPYFSSVNISDMYTSFPGISGSSDTCNISGKYHGLVYSNTTSAVSLGNSINWVSPGVVNVFDTYLVNSETLVQLRYSVIRRQTVTAVTNVLFNGTFLQTPGQSFSCEVFATDNPRCTQPDILSECTGNVRNMYKTPDVVVSTDSVCMFGSAANLTTVFDVYVNVTMDFSVNKFGVFVFDILPASVTPSVLPAFAVYRLDVLVGSMWSPVPLLINACDPLQACTAPMNIYNPITSTCPTQSASVSQSPMPTPSESMSISPSESLSTSDSMSAPCACKHDLLEGNGPNVVVVSQGDPTGLANSNCFIGAKQNPLLYTNDTGASIYEFKTPLNDLGGGIYEVYGVLVNSPFVDVRYSVVSTILTSLSRTVVAKANVVSRINEGFQCGDEVLYENITVASIKLEDGLSPPLVMTSSTRANVTCSASCPFQSNGYCAVSAFVLSFPVTDIMPSWLGDSYLVITFDLLSIPPLLSAGVYEIEVFDGFNWISVNFVENECHPMVACEDQLDYWITNLNVCATESSSPSQSFPNPAYRNCSTPFNTVQFDTSIFVNMSKAFIDNGYLSSYYENEGNIYTDYYDDFLENNNDLSHFLASQAGTNNCSKYDRVWQRDDIVTGFTNSYYGQVRANLYMEIFNYFNGSHSIANVLTADPLLNITLTYIQPHVQFSESETVALNCTLTDSSGCMMNGYMIDSIGAYTDTCTDVTNRGTSRFYGVKGMNCTVLSYRVTSNATNDCQSGCYAVDQDGHPNYSCDEITLNCVEEFPVVPLDQSFAPGNWSFVFFAPGNDENSYATIQKFSLVNMSISNGAKFVKVDIVAREDPNFPCEGVFKLEPVTLELPVCCTPEYVDFLHPLSHDTSISQTYEPYECAWQQKLENTRDYVVPQIGYSIAIPANHFIVAFSMTFSYYFSREHVNALFEQALFIDPDFNGDVFDFFNTYEGVIPGSPTATYGSTCGLTMIACDFPTLFECYPNSDLVKPSQVTSRELTIDTCPGINATFGEYNAEYLYQPMQYNVSFVAVYDLRFLSIIPFYYRPNKQDEILFNIAWNTVFPGDVVLIDKVTQITSDLAASTIETRHKTTPCTGPFNTDPICTCLDCGLLTQQTTSESVMTYATTPLIVDNNMKQTHDNNQRFSRRAPSNPDFPVSANLYGFIRDSIDATPSLANMTTPAVASLMKDNDCGVLVNVEKCSNNLQVWFRPNVTVSTQNLTLPFKNYSSIRCTLVVTHSHFTGPPMPLTDKVYVADDSDWQAGPYVGINIYGPTEFLIPFDIVSSSYSIDPSLRFDQSVYGIEIPISNPSTFGGVYMYCDTGVATSNVTRQPVFTRNATTGMNYCVSRQRGSPGDMLVEPMDDFAQNSGNNTYRMHLMAAPSCPSFGMCPPQWFINQPYEVNHGRLGSVLQFPSDDLIQNQSISILPYEVDITFKLTSPELQVVVDEYIANSNSLFNILLFSATFQGPYAPSNFLDVDIILKDGTCASKQYCTGINAIFNKTGTFYDFVNTAYIPRFIRTMGMGAKLGEGAAFNTMSTLDVGSFLFNMGPCYTTLVNNGYTLSDMAFMFKFKVDNLTTYNASEFNDVDYSEGPGIDNNPYGQKGEDAITRRFYVYDATFSTFIIDPRSLTFPTPASSIVTYSPNGTCGRQPFTVVNTCDGVCEQFTSRGVLYDSVNNITAKAENHPNATFYDSVGLNSTRVNEQLLQINFPYDPNNLQIQPGQTYQDDIITGASVCNYWATLLSHDIAVNGTAHVISLNLTLPPEITSGVTYSIAAFMSTYKTELLIQALNMFSMTIAAPWIPGVFLTFDNETQMVHVFGTSIGIAIVAHANSTILEQPICNNDPNCQGYPKPVIMFYDFYVPNVTRDMVNLDADLISHATDFIPGPFFSQGVNPLESADYYASPSPHPAYGPDEASLMRTLDMCSAYYNSYNPMQGTQDANEQAYFAYGSTRNYGDAYIEPIQYPNLVGNDPNITTRLGNGVNDGGMLGALPIVASFYARSTLRITYMAVVYYYQDNIAGNNTNGRQRFRLALYPCFTKCPNNATHFMQNHPDFSAISFMNAETTTLVTTATNDLQVFNLTGNQYTENTVYDEMNIDEILNSVTSNLVGGVVYSYQYKTGARRGATVSEGSFVLVLNVDKTDIGEVLALIGNENVTAYVYDILQLTSHDLGLYMNFRDSLGSIDMFGLVFGVLYYREIGFPSEMMVPYDVVLSTFGNYDNNRDLVLFPILRKDYDNDLYLASTQYCNNYTGSCRQTGAIRSYYLNNQGPVTGDPLLQNFGFEFNATNDNGLLFYDTLASVGYQGTQQYIVTAYGNYTPTDTDPFTTGYDGGFRLICADCWDAFNDGVYFNWFNVCPVFFLCSISNTVPAGSQCIAAVVPSQSVLNLTIPASASLLVEVAWATQNLTSSLWVNAIVTIVATGKACVVYSSLNNVSIAPVVLPLNVPVSVYATIPFDGDNLAGSFLFNMTGCAPLITNMVINYTFPVPCPSDSTESASFSQSASLSFSQSVSSSASDSASNSDSLTPSESSTSSDSNSNSDSPIPSNSNSNSKSPTISLSQSDSSSASKTPEITQSPLSQTPAPTPSGSNENDWVIILVSSLAALVSLLLMLLVYLCARMNKPSNRNTSINTETQPLVGNRAPTYSHKRYE